MSAWPEAVYILKEIEKQLGLTDRVVRLENRLYVFAKKKASTWEPDLTKTYNFSEDSVWFIETDDINSNGIYAASVYINDNGTKKWSDPIYFSINGDKVSFTPSDPAGVLKDVTNVEDALNTLAARGGGGGGGGTADALKTEDIIVSNWSTTTTTYTGDNSQYYYANVTVVDTEGYGDHPAISLAATGTNNLPTPQEVEAFNKISYVLVNDTNKRQLTFLAKERITINLTVSVKL